MSEAPPLEARIEHPAPERSQVGLARLLTGLCAAPCAWVLQLLAMYALASNACTPTAGRHGQQINAGFPGEVAALIGLNLLFFALAVAGGLLSWRNGGKVRREGPDDVHAQLSIGEGRTRFLALAGGLGAIAFAIAILFNTVEPIMLSSCRSYP